MSVRIVLGLKKIVSYIIFDLLHLKNRLQMPHPAGHPTVLKFTVIPVKTFNGTDHITLIFGCRWILSSPKIRSSQTQKTVRNTGNRWIWGLHFKIQNKRGQNGTVSSFHRRRCSNCSSRSRKNGPNPFWRRA